MNFLFPLSFVARVSLGNRFETLTEPLTGGMLLRIREQLIGLRANLTAFIISKLLTHLLNKDQQRPPRPFLIATSFSDTPGTFYTWLRILLTPNAAKNYTLSDKGLSEERVLTTSF
jgi:hypothetical protein